MPRPSRPRTETDATDRLVGLKSIIPVQVDKLCTDECLFEVRTSVVSDLRCKCDLHVVHVNVVNLNDCKLSIRAFTDMQLCPDPENETVAVHQTTCDMGAKTSIVKLKPHDGEEKQIENDENRPEDDSTNVNTSQQPINRNFAGNRPVFDDRQKHIVRDTWVVVNEDIKRVGVVMFMKLFEMHPNLQDVFIPLRGVSKDELKNNSQLRYHALRVMSAVEKVISRLDEPVALTKLLHELGARHVTYNAKVDYIDLIGPQFIAAIQPSLKDIWDHEIEEAWSDLFKLIAHLMKETMTF